MREVTTKKISKKAQAPIPTKHGTFNVMAYSLHENEPMPHIVLVNEKTDFSLPVNVRVHSECMTGDVFGSHRCECGEQLDWAMSYIAKHGGIVIYLRQEGRGIGIINKLHAYTLQDKGFNTAEANKELGFGYDDRTYEDALEILRDLNVKEINLVTNNPDKIKGLSNVVVKVNNRIPIEITPRKENLQYLKTKRNFFGHKLNL